MALSGSDLDKESVVLCEECRARLEENQSLEDRIKVAADTCLSFASIGGPQTMTNFNNK